MRTKTIECVMQGDKPIPIVEMWESYSGWYWFITEINIDKEDPNYMFGLVCGFENEWGYVDRKELKSLRGSVWPVPRKNWFSNSHVKLVEVAKVK